MSTKTGKRVTKGRAAMALGGTVFALVLAGCSPTGGSTNSQSTDTGSASTSASSATAAPAATVAASGCGSLPGALPTDPDGVLAALPTAAQAAYSGAAGPILKPAAYTPPAKPWKIGYASFPIVDNINKAYVAELQKKFDAAKAQGLVTGSLDIQSMPDPTAMTPAAQIQNYQTLLRDGANAIILEALAPAAMSQTVDAAGKNSNVVTFSYTPIPNSTYGFGVGVPFYQDAGIPAAAILNQLGGTGNVLVVHGIQGVDPETYGAQAIKAALSLCSGIKDVGDVNAQFTDATAKTAIQTWLAAHPGVKVDAVLEVGAMSTGIIEAFKDAGLDVPLVEMNGANSGALEYWNENAATWSTAGSAASPEQQADAVWDAMIRTLEGKQPKTTTIALPANLLNNGNLSKVLVSGAKSLQSTDSMGSGIPYYTTDQMDAFFSQPGE